MTTTSDYTRLKELPAQQFIQEVQRTPYPFLERIGSLLYTYAWESAAALSGGFSHFYMVALQQCSWIRVKTPSLEDRNLVVLDENTLAVAQASQLIDNDEANSDFVINFTYALNTANKLASIIGMEHVKFYIDFHSSKTRYDKTHPSVAVLTLHNIKYLTHDQIGYLIARKLAHYKIGYGLRKPLYHSLYHSGMIAIHAGIITCWVRRMISIRSTLFLSIMLNFVSRLWTNYLLREKICRADQIALQYLQTNTGMVTYFHKKVFRNYLIRHGSFEDYQLL